MMPKTVRVILCYFLPSIVLQNIEKMKEEIFEELEKISEKQKMRNLNSLIVPKNLKEGTLWDFVNIHSVAKYQKKKEDPLEKKI